MAIFHLNKFFSSKTHHYKFIVFASAPIVLIAVLGMTYVNFSNQYTILNISDPNAGVRAAAINDNFAALKYHHEKGGDINQSDGIAIRWAAWNGDLDITRYLLEHGADPQVLGDQPLRNAQSKGYGHIAELILDFHRNQEKAPLDWDEKVSKTEVNKSFSCQRARLKNAYHGKGGFKYLIKGKEDWLFRSDVDFQELFTISHDTRRELGRFVNALKDHGISLVMVVQPTRGIVARNFLIKDVYDPELALANYKRLIQYFNNIGIIAPDLLEIPDMSHYFLKRDIHWTNIGADQTAQLVAQAMQPIMSNISRKKYTTAVSGKEGFKGGLLEAYESVCNMTLEEEGAKLYKTTTDEGDLFGDAIPQVTLVGTSNSEISRANFSGALAEHLSTDVLNMAVSGGGVSTSILDYLSSEEFKKYPPKIIVWEFRANDKLTPSLFSQLIPTVYRGCEKVFEKDVVLNGATNIGMFPPQKKGRGYIKISIEEDKPISLKFSSVYSIRKTDPVEMVTTDRMKRKEYYIDIETSQSDFPKSIILETPQETQTKARVTFCGYPDNGVHNDVPTRLNAINVSAGK